jgi:hypothetical protein
MDFVVNLGSLWWRTGHGRTIGTKSWVLQVLGRGQSRTPISLIRDSPSMTTIGNPAQGWGVNELFDSRTLAWVWLEHPVDKVVKRIGMVFLCHECWWILEFNYTRLIRSSSARALRSHGNFPFTIGRRDIHNKRNTILVSLNVTVRVRGKSSPFVVVSSPEGVPLLVTTRKICIGCNLKDNHTEREDISRLSEAAFQNLRTDVLAITLSIVVRRRR